MRVAAQGLVCAAAAAMLASSASASLPSRLWLGVERIAIECEFTGPIGESAKHRLCSSFVEAAAEMTPYPVALGARNVAGPERDAELVLRLFISSEGGMPRALSVASRAERNGLSAHAGPRVRALPVALAWQQDRPVLTGPVLPLAIHLAPPDRARPLLSRSTGDQPHTGD